MKETNQRKTKTHTNKKKGISLIVLVITIIVMIILAAAVILSLSSSGIIGRANEAVTETDLKQVQTLASTIWSEVYLENLEGANLNYATEVPKRLEEQGIDTTKYEIVANESGVTVKAKSNDKTAPVLTINTPESNDEANPTQVASSSFTVTGKVEDESAIKNLTVNGTETSVNEDGTWSYTITLNANETTTITVVAIDENDNTTTVTRYVYYFKVEAGLYNANDELVASWDELVNTYGMDVETNYTGSTYNTAASAPYKVLSQSALSTGVKLVIDDGAAGIGNNAFGYTKLTSITIPDSVTSIGQRAFQESTTLTSVTFGENSQLTSIGDNVFINCTNLTDISIPNSVTSIGTAAFNGCTNLANITIPDGVTTLGEYVFEDCTGLVSGTIGDGVTNIGASTFYNCTSLTNITIPEGVTSIGQYAFRNCKSLTSITFEGTVEQWNAISKNSYWKYNSTVSKVVCTGDENGNGAGTVSLA